MIIMALDHVRDFVHVGAMTFSPEDLARTTPLLFFTRWVTHICAPTFFLLAGFGASFRLQRTGSKNELSWFLLTRGLWLIVIELTLMRLAMNFTFSSRVSAAAPDSVGAGARDDRAGGAHSSAATSAGRGEPRDHRVAQPARRHPGAAARRLRAALEHPASAGRVLACRDSSSSSPIRCCRGLA